MPLNNEERHNLEENMTEAAVWGFDTVWGLYGLWHDLTF